MVQTQKIAIALPYYVVEAAEQAVADGRAGTIHAYFTAALELYERQSKIDTQAAADGSQTAAQEQ